MTPGSVERQNPVLVLGLGNALLADDAVGLVLWGRLSACAPAFQPAQVEFLDGGTQGLALLGRIAARPALRLPQRRPQA